MNPRPTSAKISWLRISAHLAVIGAAVCYFSFVTADPDLWGHIKFGEALWKNGALVRTDPYSFTAHGNPWINHEWLAELIFYFIYHYFKDAGLLMGKLGIGIAIVIIMGRICGYRRNNAIVYAMVMITAVMIMAPGFMIRPQVFSLLLFTVYLQLLYLYFVKDKNRLYLLPCLMIFWVNLHGGFLMGLALLFAVVMWKSFSHLVFCRDDRLGRLWFWFVVTMAATLFNPYGYELLIFLYKTLSLPRQIGEWRPITLFDLSYLHVKVLALLFFCVALLRARRKDEWETPVIVVVLIAAVLHQRHSPFFGIIVAPFLVHHLSIVTEDIHYRFPQATLTGRSKKAIAVVLGLLAAYQTYDGCSRYTLANYRIIVDTQKYPVAAVEYLKKNNISGRLLLPLEWGEYAIWKLYPECTVSIDGRFRTVYPESVIADHFVAEHDADGWSALIEKYPADILLTRQIDFFQKLMKNSESWVYIYSDLTTIVFLRNNEKNDKVLQKFKSGQFIRPGSPSIYFP